MPEAQGERIEKAQEATVKHQETTTPADPVTEVVNPDQAAPVDYDDRKWGVRTVYISWVSVYGGRDAIGGRCEAEALAKRFTAEHLAEPHDPEQLVAYIAAPYSGWDPAHEDEMAEFWKKHGINPETKEQP